MAVKCLEVAGRSGTARGLSSLPPRPAGASGSLLVTLTFSGGLVLCDGADVMWGGFGVVPHPSWQRAVGVKSWGVKWGGASDTRVCGDGRARSQPGSEGHVRALERMTSPSLWRGDSWVPALRTEPAGQPHHFKAASLFRFCRNWWEREGKVIFLTILKFLNTHFGCGLGMA